MASDEFLKVHRDLEDASRPRRAHPKGWEPGVDTAKGTLTVQAGATPPTDWSVVIRELGLDSSVWTVDESQPVQVRSWDSGSQRLYYYRATVTPLSSPERPDVDALVGKVRRLRKKPPASSGSVRRTLLIALADWQAGKGTDDKAGVEQLLERLVTLDEAVHDRVAELKRAGRPVSQLAIVGLGDLVEGCSNHYAMQTFQTELDNREQMRLVRRMLVELITSWVKLAPEMVVGCVPGNHGERRQNGKAYTTFGDNADVEAFETAREICQANPEVFGHIRWAIPEHEQTITLDLSGTIVGFAHGHQFRAGNGPQGKALRWWKEMAMNRSAIGDADVLVSGHFHHLQVHAEGTEDSPKGRTWFQCPALDAGSTWWEIQGGAPTKQGTLTVTLDGNGWDDLKVLR